MTKRPELMDEATRRFVNALLQPKVSDAMNVRTGGPKNSLATREANRDTKRTAASPGPLDPRCRPVRKTLVLRG